eukprot:scaffold6009_cov248-Pinguiococcus_pyrenoidosus.AAC.7
MAHGSGVRLIHFMQIVLLVHRDTTRAKISRGYDPRSTSKAQMRVDLPRSYALFARPFRIRRHHHTGDGAAKRHAQRTRWRGDIVRGKTGPKHFKRVRVRFGRETRGRKSGAEGSAKSASEGSAQGSETSETKGHLEVYGIPDAPRSVSQKLPKLQRLQRHSTGTQNPAARIEARSEMSEDIDREYRFGVAAR